MGGKSKMPSNSKRGKINREVIFQGGPTSIKKGPPKIWSFIILIIYFILSRLSIYLMIKDIKKTRLIERKKFKVYVSMVVDHEI